MATNHTTNYQLNLWEPTDKFSREEINENSEKLDAAVAACFRPSNLPWVSGNYTQPQTGDVTITLGFRPSVVFFTTSDPSFGIAMGAARFLVGNNRNISGNMVLIGFNCQFLDDGFLVNSGTSYYNDDPGRVVTYIAFR